MAWTPAQCRTKRAEYDRFYRTGHARDQRRQLTVPAGIDVLDRDPFPCTRCGEREGCRHRSVFGW